MAVAEHNVSRREVLAATWALPIAQVASSRKRGPSQTQQRELGSGSSPEHKDARSFVVTKWDRALAQLRRAEAALAAAAHEPDEEVAVYPERLPAGSRRGDILVAFNRALKRLLRAPAPDLPALALKLELAARESAWELTGAETCIAALAREARRLSLS